MIITENLHIESKRNYVKPRTEDVWYDHGSQPEWRWQRTINPRVCLLHRDALGICGCPSPTIVDVFAFLEMEWRRIRGRENFNRLLWKLGSAGPGVAPDGKEEKAPGEKLPGSAAPA